MPEGRLSFFRFVQTGTAGAAVRAAMTGLAMIVSPFSSLRTGHEGQAKGRKLPKSIALAESV
jgi:hypothetical protein